MYYCLNVASHLPGEAGGVLIPGGVFQFGLQYGAGIKYCVSPHIIVRADYRENWSKNPDLVKSSYLGYESPDVDAIYTTDVLTLKPPSKFFQDRFTTGIAFAF